VAANASAAPHPEAEAAIPGERQASITPRYLGYLFVNINAKIRLSLERFEVLRTDALMSAIAMFSLKSPSLLAFDKQRTENHVCTMS